jgi:TonB family protein
MPPKTAALGTLVLLVVGACDCRSASAFPLPAARAAAQGPVLAAVPSPGQAVRPGTSTARTEPDEAALKRNIQLNPSDLYNYFTLATIYENAGDLLKAEAAHEAAIKAVPNDAKGYLQAAGFYNRHGNFDKALDALNRRMAVEPQNPEAPRAIAAFCREWASGHPELPAIRRMTIIQAGLQAADRALALNPKYFEGLNARNMLLRLQATLEDDAGARQQLIAEADALRDQTMAISATEPRATILDAFTAQPAGIPPTTEEWRARVETALAVARREQSVLGGRYAPDHPLVIEAVARVRTFESEAAAGPPRTLRAQRPDDGPAAPAPIGRNIRAPRKIVDVKPVVPEGAGAAGPRGIAIVQITVGFSGKVIGATIVRSDPLLEEAALEAVRQWEFERTLVGKRPVPVIMTVAVDFRLDR